MDKKMFKVYKSAAGSGKTYTLVKEYLKIVLKNTWKYNRILAITFTNKAANEMKSRIIEALSEIALLQELPEKGLAKELLDELQLSFEQLTANSQKVLQNILHNFSDFSISTIDSFTHRIVRTFAFDLKLPLKFDIELNNEVIINQAVDSLMEQIGKDEQVSKILLEFMYSKLKEDKSWHIDRDLKQQAKQLQKEDIEHHLSKIKSVTIDEFIAIANIQRSENKKLKALIQQTGKMFFDEIGKRNLSEADFYQGSRGICGMFSKIEKFDGKEVQPSKTLQGIIENQTFSKPKDTNGNAVLVDEMSSDIVGWVRLFFEQQKQYISRKLFLENLYAMAVLNELSQLIQQQSAEEKVLHISEFNKRIAKIVLEEPVPFLYERIGERYQHYLIDEFQDTSVLQWQNLLPLLENGLSQNHFSMIVGDSKQAIYRFRQGEVEQFESLPEVYQKNDNHFLEDRERTLIQHYELDVLKYNYRSRKTIVEFNNEFFQIAAQNYLESQYQKIFFGDEAVDDPGVKQLYKKDGGYLSLEFLDKKELDRKEYVENTCIRVYSAIEESLSDGFLMKDICILTRTHKDLSILSEYLSQKTINNQPILLASDESFKLNSSPKVRFMIAVLQYLNQPMNQTSWAHILGYLIEQKKIKQSDILPLFQKKSTLTFEGFMKNNGYDLYTLSSFSASLYDVCEKIVRFFALHTVSDIYVASFLNIVASYARRNEQNIASFLQWYMEGKDTLSAKSSEELNAIHMMTIHKSKGLGFPVVIYPFADSKCNTTFNLWIDTDENLFSVKTGLITTKKETASSCFSEAFFKEKGKAVLDMVNVLYVALTRAKDRLYITCEKPADKDGVLSYPAMFRDYVAEKGLSSEASLFTFGDRECVGETNNETSNEKALPTIISSDWTKRPIENRRNISVKDRIASELSTEKGIVFHEALSYIYTKEDSDRAIQELILRGRIQEDEQADFSERLKSLLSHPDMQAFFDAKSVVKTETEIIADGNSYRIDRLIMKADETLVVDFKTGAKRKEHKLQIDTYCNILKEMNLPEVKGFLVYINQDTEVVRI